MSKAAREEILGKIRNALNRDNQRNDQRDGQPDRPGDPQSLKSTAPVQSQRPAEITEQQREQLVEKFELELARVGGHFYVARAADSICEYVEHLACQHRAKSVISWDAPVINEIGLAERLEGAGVQFIPDDGKLSDEEFISEAIRSGIGITGADYALADTGTLVLLAGRGRARSASLVAPVHIAILKPEQIIPGLNELIPLLNDKPASAGPGLPSAVAFITGPSRTADIELTIVIGVHGPQELHVVLLT